MESSSWVTFPLLLLTELGMSVTNWFFTVGDDSTSLGGVHSRRDLGSQLIKIRRQCRLQLFCSNLFVFNGLSLNDTSAISHCEH